MAQSRKMCKALFRFTCCCVIGFAGVVNASPKNYHDAKLALAKQDYAAYHTHLDRMGDYLLKPLVEAEYLLDRMDSVNGSYLERFVNENADVYTSNHVRIAYLNRLLETDDRETYLRLYTSDVNDVRLECHYLDYWLAENEINDETDLKIEQLWLTANSRPDSCSPLFKKWRGLGKMTSDRIWGRIDIAMAKGRYQLARYLAREYLPTRQKNNVELWIEVKSQPSQKLRSTRFSSTPLAGKIIADGMEEMSRTNPADADHLWRELKNSNESLGIFESQVYAGIGFRAAINHKVNATDYLKKASFDDEKVRLWAIRSAAREQDWQAILDFFPHLHEAEKTAVDWRYWQARALENTGNKDLARAIFTEISTQRDYYSFLAADRVDRDYQMNNRPITESTQALENSRAFKIAKELYQVEDASYMRRQWQWAIRNLDSKNLKAAAKIASNWGFHDRAIITAGKARYFDDVDLRFPLIHEHAVLSQAKYNKLPQAYVYGIMRQESAFIENVRSSAGALGLMQIMPDTGKLIWKKQKKSNYRSSNLLDPLTNIAAGSFYLRDMLNQFDEHYAMATAAYNAGPRRPKKWRAGHAIDADIWIENIPFKETRGYVKNVLTYKAIYDHKLGHKNERISQLLPKVNAG